MYNVNNEIRTLVYSLQYKIVEEASSIFREALAFVKNHDSSLNDIDFAYELGDFVYKQSRLWLERILLLMEIIKKGDM